MTKGQILDLYNRGEIYEVALFIYDYVNKSPFSESELESLELFGLNKDRQIDPNDKNSLDKFLNEVQDYESLLQSDFEGKKKFPYYFTRVKNLRISIIISFTYLLVDTKN